MIDFKFFNFYLFYLFSYFAGVAYIYFDFYEIKYNLARLLAYIHKHLIAMNEENKKDKVVAGVLAFVLGTLGAHHFYLGNGGTGILYLLFCWFPVTWIAAIVDGIQLLTRHQADFDRRYNPHLYMRQYEQKNITATPVNVADEIYKLDLLFRRGIITFEEFEKRKAKLLE